MAVGSQKWCSQNWEETGAGRIETGYRAQLKQLTTLKIIVDKHTNNIICNALVK